jgi:hypothetical protein
MITTKRTRMSDTEEDYEDDSPFTDGHNDEGDE